MVTAMEYHEITQADLRVSRITLGTVELGMEYGIGAPGKANRPQTAEAEAIIRTALENGINLLDTAPAYGESEVFVGKALRATGHAGVHIATKIGPFGEDAISADAVLQSLERSLRNLGRERLDLVQIHNATACQLFDSPLMEILMQARDQGKIGAIGASVYGEEAAMASLTHPDIATLQIAYNLLDQRMADKVLPTAKEQWYCRAGAVRLFKRGSYLAPPASPGTIGQTQESCRNSGRLGGRSCPDFTRGGPAVLSGGECSELRTCRRFISTGTAYSSGHCRTRGRCPTDQYAETCKLAVSDETIIDPRFWGID